MVTSLAKLSALHTGRGWTYLYPSLYGGHTLGMISSFCYIFGVLIAMGFVAQQAGIWMSEIIPIAPIYLSLSIVLILTLIVIAGTQTSSIGQYIISAIVVLSIIITSVICMLNFNPKLLTPFMPYGVKSVFTAAPKVLFGYLGFECVVSLYSITHNPQKNVMKAAISGVIFVGLLYLMFATTILAAIQPNYFSLDKGSSLAIILTKVFPQHKYLNNLIYIGGLFAILGTLHSMIWTTSLLSLDVLKKIKNRAVLKIFNLSNLSMKKSVLLSALIICISSMLLHEEIILSAAVLLMTITYVLSIVSIFLKKEEMKSFKFLYASLAIIGGILMIGFSINSRP